MLFRVPEHISVELKKEFLRSNQQFVNSNGSFRTQLGLRPLRFRLCSHANTTKVVSTRRWHNTKISTSYGCFVSPSCVPNKPFEFMNRQFDLKNSFFSSTEICSGTRNGIHWEEYSSAHVLTWFYGNVLA